MAISQQYYTPRCTLYYWLSRYEKYHTYENRSSAPHRTVDGQGCISWKRYRLYVRMELKQERVEIQEFFDSLIITYRAGAVASYSCIHERSQVTSVSNNPVFHDHPEIKTSAQLELFDFSHFQLRYVGRRPPNRKHPPGNAIQLMIEGLR